MEGRREVAEARGSQERVEAEVGRKVQPEGFSEARRRGARLLVQYCTSVRKRRRRQHPCRIILRLRTALYSYESILTHPVQYCYRDAVKDVPRRCLGGNCFSLEDLQYIAKL